MYLVHDYQKQTLKRTYLPLKDTQGLGILETEELELVANFSFVDSSKKIIKQKLSPYNIDIDDFCVFFDGATFEYFPKQLKVTVFIYDHYYSFEFTKPPHLGQPLSKNTEQYLLGQAPK